MNIRSELVHAFHPHKSRFFWVSLYAGLTSAIAIGILAAANHIQTRISPQGSVTLSTNYSKYIIGEPISYTLTNNYNSSIYFTNQCPAEPLAIYRKSPSGWTRLHGTAEATSCTSLKPQTIIPALSTATSGLLPWKSMFSEPGTYRLVAIVSNGSNTLPYADFDIIQPPVAIVHQNIIPNTTQSKSAGQTITPTTQPKSTSTVSSGASNVTPVPIATPPPTKRAPQTFTLTMNNSGNYTPTTLMLLSGDSIQFVYSQPRQNEVRTRFTAKAPTTSTLSSVTLDSEFTTRTVMYTTAGVWTYKADDYSGNSGTLTITN